LPLCLQLKQSRSIGSDRGYASKETSNGSNHGGLMEIILDNETGFLVEPNNEKELYEALLKLIENRELRNIRTWLSKSN
jgi:glycosyltransferase involved in cell wall biosynthesis